MSTMQYEFKAEIKKLLDILSKSLYTHKEVFLRELISNSTDALKKIHFITLKDKDVVDPDAELRIDIFLDSEENTITVKDTGVGMTKEELIENLGTIASSGSQKFMEALEKRKEKQTEIDLDIIGQFGVGFYSVFMVADTVKVISKSYKKNENAFIWESDGTGNFTLEPIEKETRGTEIIINLQTDETEYAEKYRIESIIKKYSNFVPYPIFVHEVEEEVEEIDEEPKEDVEDAEVVEEDKEKSVDVDTEEETEEDEVVEKAEEEEEKEPEPVNEIRPLWRRPKSEITDEDYQQFYQFIAKQYNKFSHVINYKVDGRVQFRSIMFIPESKSQDLLRPEVDYGLALYSKNVMIMEKAKELIPQWMRFVKGMVDSEDIPLNISRETIQTNRIIIKIENLLVKKFFREINTIIEKEPEKYQQIWNEFGIFIKEGIVSDHPRQEKLLKLLRFKTNKTEGEEMIGLENYVNRMQEGQKEIHYLVGEDLQSMKLSPHLGYFNSKDLEVILFDEPIDNFLMMNLHDYKRTEKVEKEDDEGKDTEEEKTVSYPFKAIDVTEEEKKEGEEKEEEKDEEETKPEVSFETQEFLDHVKHILGDKIIDAKVSDRLYGNAVRLANPSTGMSSSMQRAMRYWSQSTMGKDFQIPRKILEFNPDHPTVKALIQLYDEKPEDGRINSVIFQLFDNCLLAEGDLPNPAAMAPRLNQLIEMLVTGNSNVENPAEKYKIPEKEDVDVDLDDDDDLADEDLEDDEDLENDEEENATSDD